MECVIYNWSEVIPPWNQDIGHWGMGAGPKLPKPHRWRAASLLRPQVIILPGNVLPVPCLAQQIAWNNLRLRIILPVEVPPCHTLQHRAIDNNLCEISLELHTGALLAANLLSLVFLWAAPSTTTPRLSFKPWSGMPRVFNSNTCGLKIFNCNSPRGQNLEQLLPHISLRQSMNITLQHEQNTVVG